MNRSKEKISILAMLILVSLIIGCVENQSMSGVYGKYVDKDNPAIYFELKSDKTFVGLSQHGTYDVEEDTITFKYQSGAVITGKIQDNTIIVGDSSENMTLVRQ